MDNAPPPQRRKVGVYDRPEAADRGPGMRKLVIVVAIVVAVAIGAFILV